MSNQEETSDASPTVEAVGEWLEENVLVCPEPKIINLSNFRQTEDGGKFTLTLDSITVINNIGFNNWPLNSSLVAIYMPMHCSPMGAPASYPAVEITNNTKKLIESTLRKAWKNGEINGGYTATILVN